MPIILDQHTDSGVHLMIWKDEESLDFFLQKTNLNQQELELLDKYNVERRKKDLVIARHLLQQHIPEAEVVYHPSGKPYLKNKEAEISISHSKDLVAVIIHTTNIVGIDIEYISPRVERIKKRFLSERELQICNNNELLTLYWSAKETLFKLDKEQGLEFNTELTLRPNTSNTLIGNIREGQDITISYLKEGDWVLTYATLQ